jgi:hypothetical protein
MPLFVCTLGDQMPDFVIDTVAVRFSPLTVSKLSGSRAELTPERPLSGRHMRERFVVVDGEGLQSRARAGLPRLTGVDDDALQSVAEIRTQRGH